MKNLHQIVPCSGCGAQLEFHEDCAACRRSSGASLAVTALLAAPVLLGTLAIEASASAVPRFIARLLFSPAKSR